VPVVEVRRGEARTALRAALAREETYDLVFVDPPYGDAQAWGRELPAALGPLLVHAGRIVVESNRRTPLELRLAGVSEARKRRHGDTIITIYTIDKG
jgi:16S rRNA (guanine966-N2)-methyltransferase